MEKPESILPSEESIKQDKYKFLEVLVLRYLHQTTSNFHIVSHNDDNFYLIVKEYGKATFIIDVDFVLHKNEIDEEQEFLNEGEFSFKKRLKRINFLIENLDIDTQINYVIFTKSHRVKHEYLEQCCDTLNVLNFTNFHKIKLKANSAHSINFLIGKAPTELNLIIEQYLSSQYRLSLINSKLIVDRFYTYLVNNLRYDLTKRDISLALVNLLLSTHKVDVSFKYDSCHFNSAWSDIVSDKLITVVEFDPFIETFLKSHIAGTIASYTTDVCDWNKVYDELWYSDEISLLLHVKSTDEFNDVVRIVEMFSLNLRITILSDRLAVPVCQKSRSFIAMSDLSDNHCKMLEKYNINIQGRFNVSLEKVTDASVKIFFKCNDIIRLITNNYVTDVCYCKQLPSYFIERVFLKIIVKFEILKEVRHEVFIIQNEVGTGCLLLTTLQNWNLSNVYIVEDGDLHKMEELKASNVPIHFLTFCGENWLEWQNSWGDTANICKYNVSQQINISRNLTEVLGEKRKVQLLSVNKGKSLLFNCIALRIPHDCWVLTVQLEQHCDYYKIATKNNAADHLRYFRNAALKQCQGNVEFAQRLFERFMAIKKLHILLDGFDKVPLVYQDAVLHIIRSFQVEEFYVWVTVCRLDNVALVEKRLDTVHTVIKPFSLQDQEDFLVSYFTHTVGFSSNALEFVKPLLKTLRSHLQEDDAFMGSPLHLKLIGDVLRNEFKHFLITAVVSFPVKFDLMHFLDAFLKEYVDCLISSEHCSFLALKCIFDECDLSRIDDCLQAVNEEFLSFLKDHQIFAQYLAAKWIYENLNSDIDSVIGVVVALNKKRFVDLTRYRRTFKFFDYMLAWNCPLHTALINGKAHQVELLITSDPSCLYDIDQMGRTAIHIAALYGVYHPQIFNNVIAIDDKMVNIVRLSDLKLIEAREVLLRYSTLDYALCSGTLAVANAICEKAPDLLNEVYINSPQLELYFEYCHKVPTYKALYKTLLKYSACLHLLLTNIRPNSRSGAVAEVLKFNEVSEQNISNYLRTFDVVTVNHLLEELQLKLPDSRSYTNLHLASAFGAPDNITSLLWKGESLNNLGNYSYSPLHAAVTHERSDNVNALLSMGADINTVDVFGNSSLHLACKSSYNLVSVENLLNHGADVNLQNDDGDTPLHYALQCAPDEEAVELLLPDRLRQFFFSPIAYGFDRPQHININLQNKKGDTPLLLALRYKYLRIARKLLAQCANAKIINNMKYSCLHYAVQADDYDIVLQLIHNYVDVNVRNEDGETPLFTALRFRHMDIAELLISVGADINITDNVGMHCLHYAIIANVEKIVQNLLDKGVSIDVQSDSGETPLITAIKWNRSNMAFYLISQRANPNIADGEGSNCLHHAARHLLRNLTSVLISLDVDINKCNTNGETPLLIALKQDNVSTAKLLLAHGADASVEDKNGSTCLHLATEIPSFDLVQELLDKNLDMNRQNDDGNTPLLLAIQRQNQKIMKLLLSKGADVFIENTSGFSSVHYAAQEGLDEVLTVLIGKRVDVNKKTHRGETPLMLHIQNVFQQMTTIELLVANGADLDAVNANGNSCLHFAVENGDNLGADCLISHGAQINMQNNDGDTPLHLAIKRGFTSVAQLLLSKGADPNIVDYRNGNSSLHCAVNAVEDDIVLALLNHGVDTNIVNNEGYTALARAERIGSQSILTILIHQGTVDKSYHLLFSAVKNGDVHTVATLLHEGCNINKRNENGDTPLLLALRERNIAIADLLLAKGADIEIRNNSGSTCLHFAASGGDSKIVRHLLSHGCNIDLQNVEGDTALLLALAARNKHIAQLLLDNNADIDLVPSSNSRGSCLHCAVEEGADAIVAQLLQSGFYIDKLNKYGSTPLLQAISFRNKSCAVQLLRSGADVNVENDSGWTCLHYAATSQFTDIINLLLDNGANINIMNENISNAFMEALQSDKWLSATLLLSRGANINTKNLWGGYPLHYAASQGFDDIVSEILDRGFDIDKTDDSGNSPLFCALKSDKISTVQLLLSRGARTNIHNDHHYNCLHLAAEAGLEELVRKLINDGFDVNEENDDSYTPLQFALRTPHVNIVKLLFRKIILSDFKANENYLHCAAEFGNNEIVSALIDKGYDVNKQNNNDKVPLLIALQHNNLSTAKLLIANGATCNVVDTELSFCPLHYFAEHGENELLLRALSEGVDINIRHYDGSTPLSIAVKNERFTTVQLLLEQGADPNICDDHEKCPLHYAVECNSQRILKAILSYITNTCFNSLISYALERNHSDLPEILLGRSTDDAESVDDDTILQQAVQKGFYGLVTAVVDKYGNIDQTNKHGDTALLLAYKCIDEEMIKLLLKLGANPNIANKHAYSCLHYAVKCSEEILIKTLEISDDHEKINFLGSTPLLYALHEGDIDSAQLLIEHGANINVEDKFKNTSLHLATKAGASALAKYLIDKGLDIHKKNAHGETCWDLAINKNQLSIINLLLEHGANVHDVNKHGETAMLKAVELGDVELVAKLLEKNVDLNTQNNLGQTPFLMALENKKTALAKLLISNGADVTVRNTCGSNLHLAVSQGVEIVEEFLKLGFDINEQDENGDTPLLLALRCKMPKLFTVLLKADANIYVRNNDGNSCLHYAIDNNEKITRELIGKGIDVNTCNTLGDSPLLKALRLRKLRIAEILLANGAEFDISNNYGNSCLYYAAKAGFVKLVRDFIAKGVDIDRGNQYSVTPFLAALRNKRKTTIELLIEKGANVNVHANNVPIVNHICSLNNVEILNNLIAKGYDINYQCNVSDPLLLSALKSEYRDIANFLIAKGANIHLTSFSTGASCLHYAAKAGYDEIVECLIDGGLDINRENNSHETPLRLAFVDKRDSTVKLLLAHGASVYDGTFNCTYLHYAAEIVDDFITLELIKRGCNVNAANGDGNTPLFLSIISENFGTAKLLLENGADTGVRNKDGYDILHYASLANAYDDVLKLIRAELD